MDGWAPCYLNEIHSDERQAIKGAGGVGIMAVGSVLKKKKPFDPEGSGYDYEAAQKAGLKPGPDGHWPSREPKTGLVLKGRKHPTYGKALRSDVGMGYAHIKRKNGRYYSVRSK